MGCRHKFSLARIHEIWESFYCMSFDARRQWVYSFVSRKIREGKRPLYTFHLPDEDNNRVVVCCKLFNRTIGYHDKNNMVQSMMPNTTPGALAPKLDGRGRAKDPKAINRDAVKRHILSIPGGISHYRRAHAPNVRYVPPELSYQSMYDLYKESPIYQEDKAACCYEIYRQVCHELNISNAKLGHEECEACELLKEQPASLRKHKRKVKRVRKEYRRDSERQTDDQPVYTLDLQRVMMLPRLEQFKKVIFTRRVVAFHHTMAPAGGTTANRPTLSSIWHEGIAGRLGKEIASIVLHMIKESHLREKSSLILWMDNCAPQNKNYTLFSALWSLINSDMVDLDVLTLKYFESGHTFMSADSVHAATEREIKKAKNVIDLGHFRDCVQKATKNTKVFEPGFRDFLDLQRHASARRLSEDRPKLSELCLIELRRGSNVLYVKRKFAEEFSQFDYLQKKVKRSGIDLDNVGALHQAPRGIPSAKKAEIVSGIVPIIKAIGDGRHARRARFYERMAVCDEVADLAVSDDDDIDGADD